jgi:hypothetical protein
MADDILLTRNDLSGRWGVTVKTVDRLRRRGLLPWLDLSGGQGGKSLVRFLLSDIEAFEARNRMAPRAKDGGHASR